MYFSYKQLEPYTDNPKELAKMYKGSCLTKFSFRGLHIAGVSKESLILLSVTYPSQKKYQRLHIINCLFRGCALCLLSNEEFYEKFNKITRTLDDFFFKNSNESNVFYKIKNDLHSLREDVSNNEDAENDAFLDLLNLYESFTKQSNDPTITQLTLKFLTEVTPFYADDIDEHKYKIKNIVNSVYDYAAKLHDIDDQYNAERVRFYTKNICFAGITFCLAYGISSLLRYIQ